MGKNDQYMHEQKVSELEGQVSSLTEYSQALEELIEAMRHDLVTSEGLWVTDKEGSKATTRLVHPSLHPEGTKEGDHDEEQSGESAVSEDDTV